MSCLTRVCVCVCMLLCVYTECAVGRFGADCQQQCECENGGQCDRLTGRCSCSDGWIGDRCEKGICCATEAETMMNLWKACRGCALETAILCICNYILYYIFHFSACEPGLFGAGCEERCQCGHGATCHHITGECQCPAGWRGKLCDKGTNLQLETVELLQPLVDRVCLYCIPVINAGFSNMLMLEQD